MGKKRLVQQGAGAEEGKSSSSTSRAAKKNVTSATLYVESTYNNTRLTLTDLTGNVLAWSSSGALGFKGAKKGTPFAAAKVGETVGDRAVTMGVKEASVVVKGIGSGREASIRSFISRGIALTTISDETPIPHNGPRQPRPRRV